MTFAGHLSFAGFMATAVTFGAGRTGFGLFLPQFRAEFGLTSALAGLLGSGGFVGFLIGIACGYGLHARLGPSRAIVPGLVVAGLGMALVATAQGIGMLGIGVFLTMASAGFTWAPYNSAARRSLSSEVRPRTLSIISTGTSIGIAFAACFTLALGLGAISWRVAWSAFAIIAVVSAILNRRVLTGVPDGPRTVLPRSSEVLRRPGIGTLNALSLSFGTTTAIYISFAADRVAAAEGGLNAGASVLPGIMFVFIGVFGLTGLATARFARMMGMAPLMRGLLVVSAVSHMLIAVLPTAWPAVIVSAGLQGMFIMIFSAIFAFSTERRFPEWPTFGFTVALLVLTVGSILGTALAGWVFDAIGPMVVFLATGGLSLLTLAVIRSGRVGPLAPPHPDHAKA